MSYRPRHARKAQPPLPLFVVFLARRSGATGRLTAAMLLTALMALALAAAMLTAASVPLARWIIH